MMNRRPYFVLALCQNEPPARIWMEYEDVGDTTDEELVYESRKSYWQFECYCTRKQCLLIMVQQKQLRKVS